MTSSSSFLSRETQTFIKLHYVNQQQKSTETETHWWRQRERETDGTTCNYTTCYKTKCSKSRRAFPVSVPLFLLACSLYCTMTHDVKHKHGCCNCSFEKLLNGNNKCCKVVRFRGPHCYCNQHASSHMHTATLSLTTALLDLWASIVAQLLSAQHLLTSRQPGTVFIVFEKQTSQSLMA